MAYQIFLSSTRLDLIQHRVKMYEALRRGGLVPLAMEDFMARPADAVEVSLEAVRDCDLFIGIYAWRYGYVPKGSRRSITEKEYREARRLKKDCIFFLVDEAFDWPAEMRETGDGAARLAAFKKELRTAWVVQTFTTPESLASFVDSSVIRWLQSRAMAGMGDLLGTVERQCEAMLREKAEPGLLDLGLEWHDRIGGPLGAQKSPREIHESGLAEGLRDRSRLLLAGLPGSGKSLALVRLARDLIAGIRRQSDPQPIPVPLSLAQWREAGQSLSDYLVWKLVDDFPVTAAEARIWVEKGRLFPLLDDLDRLTPEQRVRFAEQLRELAGSQRGLVVSSRAGAWPSDPGDTPGLQAEAVLRPLGPDQVDAYLAAGGPGLAALRQAVRERAPLRDLTRSPLLLLMMVGTWRDAPAGSLGEEALPVSEERLAEAYVQRMEEGGEDPPPYSRERTRSCLSWLSRRMRDNRMTRFEIEKLQPTWLSSPLERLLYAVLSRAAGGGLLMLLPALAPGYHRLFLAGLVMGALAGAVDFLPVWRLPASRRAGDSLRQTAVRGVLIAAVAFAGLETVVGREVRMFSLGLLIAAVFGVLFGPRPAGPREDVRFFENVRSGFSWRGAWAGAGLAAALTLLLAVLVHVLGDLSLYAAPLASLLLAPFGLVLGGILGGQGSVLELRRKPNLGLRTILRHGYRIFWRTALCTLVPAGLLAAALRNDRDDPWQLALTVLAAALAVGLSAGLWFSGMDALQHWILRGLLSATGRFPWRWVRFLDHAVDRGLLLCIDGGYEPPFEPVREFFERLGDPQRP